jgi:hypothetical protein
MSLSEINIREKKFHNELHSTGKGRPQGKFYKAKGINERFEIF